MLSTPQGEGLNGAVRGPPGRGRKYVRGSKIPAPRARGAGTVQVVQMHHLSFTPSRSRSRGWG